MSNRVSETAHGIAALAVIEALLLELAESHAVTYAELLNLLQDAVDSLEQEAEESERGETCRAAARIISDLRAGLPPPPPPQRIGFRR